MTKTRSKPKETVRHFVKRVGGQEKAAYLIGVSFTAVSRWLNGHVEPDELSRIKLDKLNLGKIG